MRTEKSRKQKQTYRIYIKSRGQEDVSMKGTKNPSKIFHSLTYKNCLHCEYFSEAMKQNLQKLPIEDKTKFWKKNLEESNFKLKITISD